MTSEVILPSIEKVVQSNHDYITKGPLLITLTHIEMPQGRGRYSVPKFADDVAYATNNRSIIFIKHKDKLCLARALAVALGHLESTIQDKRSVIHNKKTQCIKAKQIITSAGVNLVNGDGLAELQAFQTYYTNYQITIFADRKVLLVP
jgi:hypothetical protein